MKYVYCIIRDNLTLPASFPSGLGNASVYKVCFDSIVALVSDAVPNAVDNNIQNVIAHQEIVKSVSGPSSSIIPCRFGALFQSDNDIIALLEKHHDIIDKHLTNLDGKAEIGIKAVFMSKSTMPDVTSKDACPTGCKAPRPVGQASLLVPSGKTGTDYLMKKKEKFDSIKMLERQADEITENLHQATSPLWADVKVSKQIIQGALILNICYLILWQNIPDFKRKFQEFENSNSDIKLFYTGPWAPYTFADINFSENKQV